MKKQLSSSFYCSILRFGFQFLLNRKTVQQKDRQHNATKMTGDGAYIMNEFVLVKAQKDIHVCDLHQLCFLFPSFLVLPLPCWTPLQHRRSNHKIIKRLHSKSTVKCQYQTSVVFIVREQEYPFHRKIAADLLIIKLLRVGFSKRSSSFVEKIAVCLFWTCGLVLLVHSQLDSFCNQCVLLVHSYLYSFCNQCSNV